jgi:hypothetical protein
LPDGIRLQTRDITLLRSLALLRLLDRRQVERLAGFQSVSRVNVRLGKLRKAALIIRYFTGTRTGSRRSLYALTKSGSIAAGTPFSPLKWKSDSYLLGNAFVAHQSALNDIYVEAVYGRGIRWRTFAQPICASIPLIPDAFIETEARSFLIELDLGTEQLPVWTRKASLYLKLAVSGAYREITPHSQFAVLIVASDESRMHALRQHLSKQTQKLFWFATLDNIMRQGFWSSLWLRPGGDDRSPPGG